VTHELSGVPPLDGALLTDPAALAAAADDFGHTVHRQPAAVLRPGSPDDVAAIVRYARDHGLQVACRGRGHATDGQAQAPGGIVVESGALAAIHEIGPAGALVDAGVTWRALIEAALARGLTPPVVTDYLDLSVGGTLSAAGIGGASHRAGAQVDNVLELDVVTGDGVRRSCAPDRDPELFDAVLGGLGQCAVILRARMRLVPASPVARVYDLTYPSLEAFTADAAMLALDGRFDHVQGQADPGEQGGWAWHLAAASYHTPPAAPDDDALLAGLRDSRAAAHVEDVPYDAFLARIDPIVEFQVQAGVWGFPHPWFDVFVPGTAVDAYAGAILDRLTVEDTGGGPVLLFPLRRDRLTRPFFRVPDGEVCFLFDILRTAPPDPARVEADLAANRRLFESARAAGGLRYCIGSLPFTPDDWRHHFGTLWPAFERAKRTYDPDNVLTPGQGIFRR
jgi:FAD/FMN-containing dehydrogenase